MTAKRPDPVPLSLAEFAPVQEYARQQGISAHAAATELVKAGLEKLARRGKRRKPAKVVRLKGKAKA